MLQRYDRGGVHFEFPGNWTIETDEADDDGDAWTVSVHSPSTAFVLVSLRPDAAEPAELATEALDALMEEYRELDAEPRAETFAGQAAVGHDIDFLTVDTSITCWTRCVNAAAGPLLVMCQTSEYDRELNEPVLRAICASFRVERGDGDNP